jgi:nucleoside phosphorylase
VGSSRLLRGIRDFVSPKSSSPRPTAIPTQPGRRGTARVAILTIIDEEFEEARDIFETRENIPGTPYYIADLAQVHAPEVVLRLSGDRANVAAAGATAALLEAFRPEVVMLVGIAGGLSERGPMSLGDVCVPTYVHYGEFRKLTEELDALRYAAYDQPTLSARENHVDAVRFADAQWGAHIAADRPDGGQPRVRMGSIVAGDKVMGNPTHEEQQGLARRFPDAIAVDMESFGVARAVHEARIAVPYNPRLVIVRGISDLVRITAAPPSSANEPEAEDNNAQRKRWKRYAAATAAAFAKAVVSTILATPDPRPERHNPRI